ncbi:LOW QUALITY PROTEIN: inactive caspase-12-like [Phyllostomus discolor]|uniref:LOW QUALITY PROTEIN: inactive caspase-12-like n=1 Tax=Phyllostomus discolor TaxID=89673 RepID=A0A7E6DZ96_9CHIR|nr:LOW QUALITY PROTEIN: inactive caspase-12-like [Phyllostomus discolor]
MAGKRPQEDPINMVKSLAKNFLDGIFDDLMEKNVLNGDELRRLGKGVKLIVNRTESLVDDVTEKTEMAGKILVDRLFNTKKQLRLNIPSNGEGGQNTTGLIICNKEFDYLHNRCGSEVDLLGMQDLLENLGYSVVVKVNLTALEMETELLQFAARKEHQSSDSTFLVFMSHGILEGICGIKHSEQEPDILHDDTIFQIFNNRNCQSLRDKPKVIIMQACRGRGDGTVWVTDVGRASACRYDHTFQCYIWSDAVTKTHVEKDFIAFKSSTPHNSSWRVDTNGSLFIYQVIQYFKEYSWCHHLEEIFRKVQRSFEKPSVLAQMPTIERVSMTRYFYLFPGN